MTTAFFRMMRYVIAGLMLAALITVLFESCTIENREQALPSGLANDVPTCRHWMLAGHCEKVSR